jgi:glycine dehydrogenase
MEVPMHPYSTVLPLLKQWLCVWCSLRDQRKANKFFVSEEILPQTLSVLQTRSAPIELELVIGNHQEFDFSKEFSSNTSISGKHGQIYDYADFIKKNGW